MTEVTKEQLARDIFSLAQRAGMPDTYWATDSRIARARAVLNVTPDQARTTDWTKPSATHFDEPLSRADVHDPAPLEVWTDGACSGNPGPGGWGWITNEGSLKRHGNGGHPATTNQRMEIQAVLEALTVVTERPIVVVSDSQYVINGCTKWWPGWVKRGWKNSKGEAVANRDLWEPLLRLVVDKGVTFRWVKGHAGHALNEAADRLAVAGRESRAVGD